MRFLHLSDIHFLRKYHKAEKGYNSIFNNMTNPVEQIKSCLKKVDLKTIDFIIITGDLVESGSAEDYKVLKLDRLFKGIPYVVTLGNHDNKEAFYKGWFNKESNKSYNVVKEIGDLRIISFDNSNYKNSDGFISKEQYDAAMADNVYERIQNINDETETSSPYSYYVDAVIDQIMTDLQEQKGYTQTQVYNLLYSGGLSIYTAQDMSIQQICDEEFNNPDNFPEGSQVSLTYRLTVKHPDGSADNYNEKAFS